MDCVWQPPDMLLVSWRHAAGIASARHPSMLLPWCCCHGAAAIVLLPWCCCHGALPTRVLGSIPLNQAHHGSMLAS